MLDDPFKSRMRIRSMRASLFPAGPYEAVDGQEPTPMWSILVRNDVAKQLAALEKVEREEELRIRKERKDRAEMQAAHAAALAAQAAGASNMGDSGGFGDDGDSMGGTGTPKKKREKEGARNMSEDVRKKMSNAVATQAAGLGGRYAWMTTVRTRQVVQVLRRHPAPPRDIAARVRAFVDQLSGMG